MYIPLSGRHCLLLHTMYVRCTLMWGNLCVSSMVRVSVTCTGRLEEIHLSPTEENRSEHHIATVDFGSQSVIQYLYMHPTVFRGPQRLHGGAAHARIQGSYVSLVHYTCVCMCRYCKAFWEGISFLNEKDFVFRVWCLLARVKL